MIEACVEYAMGASFGIAVGKRALVEGAHLH